MVYKIKQLYFFIKSKSGRSRGRLVSYRKGGSLLRTKYIYINYSPFMNNIKFKLISIVKRNINSTYVGLYVSPQGYLTYSLLTTNLILGSNVLKSSTQYKYISGDRLQLKYLPVGTLISNVESLINSLGTVARSCGSYAKVYKQTKNFTLLSLPSGVFRYFYNKCYATVGIVNKQKWKIRTKKAGQYRLLGRRPTVRGIAKNPVDHPNGGRTNGGKVFKDMWGNLSKNWKKRKLRKNIFTRGVPKSFK